MNISFLLPTRNTLPYTKLAYSSLRKYNPDAEIVILDDLSGDGTIEWLKELKDDKVVKWFNDPVDFPHTYDDQRFSGHTLTYNIGATLAKGPLIGIFHSDMVCTENYTKNLIKHWQPKSIISATRIEPPIYPSDSIKFTKDFGIYIEDFKQEEMEVFAKEKEMEFKDKTSPNFFAPWIMSQDEYCDIGGMDPIFAPYPIEDSDFIERLFELGYDIKQSWDAICYHWCSRGHRWTTGKVQVDTDEFRKYQTRSLTEFYKKWGRGPNPPAHNYVR